MDIDPILAVLTLGLPYAAMLASLTKTQWDDKGVAFLRFAITSPEVISLLRVIFNDPETVNAVGDAARAMAITKAVDANSKHAAIGQLEAAGFTLPQIVMAIQLVYALWLQLTGKRK